MQWPRVRSPSSWWDNIRIGQSGCHIGAAAPKLRCSCSENAAALEPRRDPRAWGLQPRLKAGLAHPWRDSDLIGQRESLRWRMLCEPKRVVLPKAGGKQRCRSDGYRWLNGPEQHTKFHAVGVFPLLSLDLPFQKVTSLSPSLPSGTDKGISPLCPEDADLRAPFFQNRGWCVFFWGGDDTFDDSEC